MRTILTILLVTATTLIANAQPGYGWSGWYGTIPGDTILLNVSGYNGTIQWQQSTDSSIWSNISGATTTPYELISTTSPTNKRYYRAAIFDSLCPNATPYYSSIICYKTSTAILSIGDWFHSGIVFKVVAPNSGLIAPQSDQTVGFGNLWGCTGNLIGASSNSDGAVNTNIIYNNCVDRPIAASICNELEINGYNDWFLPAKDQLNYLYQQQNIVGDFLCTRYWSSTEQSSTLAWVQEFTTGNQVTNEKSWIFSQGCVRCIRQYTQSDGLSKTNSYAIVTNQPIAATINNQTLSQNKCIGSNVVFSITTTGTSPISYQWKKDGVDISGATGNTYTKSGLSLSDEGIYTCEVTNLCRTVSSDNAELKVIQLSANAGIDALICNTQNTTLQATGNSNHQTESGTISFSWLPSSGLSSTNVSNPTASPSITTDYIVTVSDQIGCTASDEINVFVQNPFSNEQICLVTVDTVAWKNKIMWEKTTNVGTAGFNIYKEIATNIYSGIGFVPYSDPAFLIDNSSQPEAFANRYKIAVVDTCGAESAKTYYHMTMNLTIAANGSTMGLNWSHYIDESGSFVPSLYYIYRGTSPLNMQFLASVPGTVNSYNDVNVFDVYYYIVGVEKTSGCNTAKTPTYSYSNKKDNSSLVGLNSTNLLTGTILILPNPMTNTATLTIPNLNTKATEPLQIMDITGKVVRTINSSKIEYSNNKATVVIERGDLNPGVYFIELRADRTYRGKLIIE